MVSTTLRVLVTIAPLMLIQCGASDSQRIEGSQLVLEASKVVSWESDDSVALSDGTKLSISAGSFEQDVTLSISKSALTVENIENANHVILNQIKVRITDPVSFEEIPTSSLKKPLKVDFITPIVTNDLSKLKVLTSRSNPSLDASEHTTSSSILINTNIITSAVTTQFNTESLVLVLIVNQKSQNHEEEKEEELVEPIESEGPDVDLEKPATNGQIFFSEIGHYSIGVNVHSASDNQTPTEQLDYLIIRTKNPSDIDSLDKLIDPPNDYLIVSDWSTDQLSELDTDQLHPGKTYCYGVVVRDMAGNMALYEPKCQATESLSF